MLERLALGAGIHRFSPAVLEQPIPEQALSGRPPELCFEHYARLAPLHLWLVELLPE